MLSSGLSQGVTDSVSVMVQLIATEKAAILVDLLL